MAAHGGTTRLVTVVATDQNNRLTAATTNAAPPPDNHGHCKQFQRLEKALSEVMAAVRLGAYRIDEDEEGVLLDAVVGDVRCLLLGHESKG